MRQPASSFAAASDWFDLAGHAGRGFDTRRDDDSRSRFLGKTPGGIVPAGIRTMDFRPDRDGVPQMRNLLHRNDERAEAMLVAERSESDAASDLQTAQAPAARPPTRE